MARRKGSAPVRIADAREGLVVRPAPEDIERGVPNPLRVLFGHGGNNREVLVTEILAEGERLDVETFQARYAVSDEALGRWMRAAVEAALDVANAS